jgi:hypothetical protein
MSQSAAHATPKKITTKATVQRLWDCDALASYRERCSTDEAFMRRISRQVANGEAIWVDCHDETITWVEEGIIQIGRQQYAVGSLDDSYHLRCLCFGCKMDTAYCQENHVIRVADFTYAHLHQRARAILLPDGAVIRFATPFTFGHGTYDTFRKGYYTYGARRDGLTRKTTSTVFYAVETNVPYHIINWQRLEWEIVSLPTEAEQHPGG